MDLAHDEMDRQDLEEQILRYTLAVDVEQFTALSGKSPERGTDTTDKRASVGFVSASRSCLSDQLELNNLMFNTVYGSPPIPTGGGAYD